ncbi:neuroglobin-like [Astyanax mexicanus]|uniref:Neuroglobin-like n=1 Tax=Astyanax mexicanus TaxID=7994 RepID=A0A8T2MFF0_ASTMX|nr:neuroglobin-like [Astyanax mexicanus]
MGCSGSTEKDLQREHLEELTVVHLSKEQKGLIKDSWSKIQQDVTKAGIIMFVRLFENHPECKDAFFSFRNVEDPRVQASRELRAHGLRVMSFLEKSMARIDKPERLEKLVLELGRKHYHYHSNPKYYMYLGLEFINVIKPILKDSWTSELEEAWKTLFLYLTQMMRLGYKEEEEKQCHSVAKPIIAQPAPKNRE